MEGSLPETLDRMLPSDKAGEREVPRTRNNSRHPIALRSFTPLASSDETVPCPVQKFQGLPSLSRSCQGKSTPVAWCRSPSPGRGKTRRGHGSGAQQNTSSTAVLSGPPLCTSLLLPRGNHGGERFHLALVLRTEEYNMSHVPSTQ